MPDNPYTSPTDSGEDYRSARVAVDPRIDRVAVSRLVRFRCLFLDSVLLYLGSLVIGALIYIGWGNVAKSDVPIIVNCTMVASLVLNFVYYLVSEAVFQQTIGKAIVGTKVVDAELRTPSFRQILIRTFCRFIPFEPVSFLFKKVGWHDSISNTIVVHSDHQTQTEEESPLAIKIQALGDTIKIDKAFVSGKDRVAVNGQVEFLGKLAVGKAHRFAAGNREYEIETKLVSKTTSAIAIHFQVFENAELVHSGIYDQAGKLVKNEEEAKKTGAIQSCGMVGGIVGMAVMIILNQATGVIPGGAIGGAIGGGVGYGLGAGLGSLMFGDS